MPTPTACWPPRGALTWPNWKADRRGPEAGEPTAGGLTLDASYTIERERIEVKNVIGVLEGAGPLADETIVVGAHYDHLGRGGIGLAGVRRPRHPQRGRRQRLGHRDGAGTGPPAGRAAPTPCPAASSSWPSRARSAGLLGSKHYVEHPLYPLDQTVAMVNFDMVGRLNDERADHLRRRQHAGMSELVERLGASPGSTST